MILRVDACLRALAPYSLDWPALTEEGREGQPSWSVQPIGGARAGGAFSEGEKNMGSDILNLTIGAVTDLVTVLSNVLRSETHREFFQGIIINNHVSHDIDLDTLEEEFGSEAMTGSMRSSISGSNGAAPASQSEIKPSTLFFTATQERARQQSRGYSAASSKATGSYKKDTSLK